MNPKDLVKELRSKIANELFEAVCDLYRDIRVLDFMGEDQDMLLYQYGIYDWGQGEKFELDLTRQFMSSDGEVSQLKSTLFFEPTSELRSIPEKIEWCSSPSELDEFIQSIQCSNGYIACRSENPTSIVVEYESV